MADGMGGHQAGEIAADMAIGQLGVALVSGVHPDGRLLVDSIERANSAIRREARTRPELLGMGTTCTALVVADVVTIAHVGDSRAYRSRAGRLEQLTDDHSLVAALVRDGRLDPAAAPTDARRHVITRALGADDDVRVDLVTVDRQPGDRFLLCSDGIHGQVDDAIIERVLAEVADPGAAADRLIALADAAGGEDNATVIVIDADLVAGAAGIVAPVGATAVPGTGRRRSRRAPAARVGVIVIGGALVVAAGAWLAGGGAGPGGPSPSVAPSPPVGSPSPSVVAPSSFGPSTVAPSSASPPAASPSTATPSVAGPSPSAPGPS